MKKTGKLKLLVKSTDPLVSNAWGQRVCDRREITELDLACEGPGGLPPGTLMQNAGRAAARTIIDKFSCKPVNTEFLILAGRGGNAGDAFVTAHELRKRKFQVSVVLLEPARDLRGIVLEKFLALKSSKVHLLELGSAKQLTGLKSVARKKRILIDGLFGTGLTREVHGLFAEVISWMNAQLEPVVSLDLPSGVDADSGEIHGVAVRASLTIAFGFYKLGQLQMPGSQLSGELCCVEIGYPKKLSLNGAQFLIDPERVRHFRPRLNNFAHKGALGHVMVIAGSSGKVGAAVMCATAAHRCGAGLVTVATWADAFATLSAKLAPQTMAVSLPSDPEGISLFTRDLHRYSAVAFGPGLGVTPEGRNLLSAVLKNYQGPLVLDADGLNLVSDKQLIQALAARVKNQTILTPHPGEAGRLLGLSKSASANSSLRQLIKMFHATVVYKGPSTWLGDDQQILIYHAPNQALAKAGSGDVLSGIIVALFAQGLSALHAASLGVDLHSCAGKFAARRFGVRGTVAPDLITCLADAWREVDGQPELQPPESQR